MLYLLRGDVQPCTDSRSLLEASSVLHPPVDASGCHICTPVPEGLISSDVSNQPSLSASGAIPILSEENSSLRTSGVSGVSGSAIEGSDITPSKSPNVPFIPLSFTQRASGASLSGSVSTEPQVSASGASSPSDVIPSSSSSSAKSSLPPQCTLQLESFPPAINKEGIPVKGTICLLDYWVDPSQSKWYFLFLLYFSHYYSNVLFFFS